MSEPSLTESTTLINAGAEVVAAAFLGPTPTLALADGNVLFADSGDERRVATHPAGAILVAASDGKRLVTGGDDGRLLATTAGRRTPVPVHRAGKWMLAPGLGRAGPLPRAAGWFG